MKITLDFEIDEEKIKQELNGGYSLTDLIKSEIRKEAVNQIINQMNVKTFNDELQRDYARDIFNKVSTLSIEKVQEYLSDAKITELVNKNLKWKVDSFIENNITQMFEKMRNEFVFIRKEEYEAEKGSLQSN